HGDPRSDGEGTRHELAISFVLGGQMIAVLKIDRELAVEITRLEAPRLIADERRRCIPVKLPNEFDVCRPGAEAKRRVALMHIASSHEADFGIERAADDEAIDLHPVPIAFVVELAAVADIVTRRAVPLSPREVGVD